MLKRNKKSGTAFGWSSEVYKSIRCALGLHFWKQNRPMHIRDIHPGFGMNYKTLTRECTRCGVRQSWLPGYGGSEIGCWTKG
jgi:hypothetical protein